MITSFGGRRVESITRKKAKANVQYVRPAVACVSFIAFFSIFAIPMGLSNMLNTIMNTAYRLLMDTAFYIMAIAVVAGAVSNFFSEFGIIGLMNKMLSPLMQPLFGMPGAAALCILTTYASDNPAVLTLAADKEFRRHFKEYQIPALTNLGTSFGMGLIVTAFVLGMGKIAGKQVVTAAICGNLGATIGGIVSTRMMLSFTKKRLSEKTAVPVSIQKTEAAESAHDDNSNQSVALQVMNSLVEGGKKGVEIGLMIVPGVLIVCTAVMMLTKGPSEAGTYTGAAFEGIGLIPWIAQKIDFILKPMFGFSSTACLAVPITALGSAGAAIGAIPELMQSGLANCGDLAVFTAICMCWSGYLCTHVAMMNALDYPQYTSKAILAHTVGGVAAGIAAHWLFILLSSL